MFSLLLRNLFFTILQPGIVAGLIPFFILDKNLDDLIRLPVRIHEKTGLFLFISGLIVMLICIFNFAVKGRGTLSPADPTKKLVLEGLYRYSRNPMYVGVMMILIGESVYTGSFSLLVYSLVILAAFHLFIVFREEPRLQRDFGEEYTEYSQKVRRWI
ncbi:isoprenylcysteine carboxyl methyltransferase [Emticicia sp. CRIBPO]|uniref:methyltransferase family protein n=1 Tax=Emticicia sp. CRIBPO TaxID=2683258 RepID=UPI001411B57A|nr:isoprenylcysteine carboxylmethyltransferase family protein [Emticicia sp. CRIBPO]NBA85933.1 isoprenylcysteine carboxyl methyltransferase [Emticicia sp. CRIBPO]